MKFLKWILFLAFWLTICTQAQALEIVRQKNAATYVFFPIVDADGDICTAATGLDSETDTYADGTAPNGFADLTNEATEIGSTGWYYISLTSGELNFDYVAIQTKTTSSGCKTQHILIRTIVGDPLNIATSDDGGTINVTGGAVDTVTTTTTATNVTTVNGIASGAITATAIATDAIGAAEIAADAIGASEIATDAVGAAEVATDAIGAAEIGASAITSSEFAQTAADLVWGTTTRILTALDEDTTTLDLNATTIGTVTTATNLTTNNDKTGYALSAAGVDAIWDETTSGHVTAGTFGMAMQIIRDGTAQAGAAGTITLDASASAVDDFYNNTIIQIVGGTGAGQSRIISDYVGSTKVATVNGNWATNPSSDSTFVIRSFGAIPGATAPTAGEVADAVWDEAASGHVTAGTFGDYLDEAVSGLDDNPWDNGTRSLTELDEDNTTIDLNASTVGTVTTATNVTTVNGLAADVITASAIATDAIGAAEIAADAIGSAEVANGAIDNATLASDTISAAKIAADAIGASELGAASITSSELAQSAADLVWGTTTRTLSALDEDSTTIDLDASTIGTATNVTTVNDKTGYALSAAGVDAIWDEVQSGHSTAGTFGKYLDAQVSTISGGSAPTAAQVADAVWDEAIADHLTAGTTGAKLNTASSAGDPWSTDVSTGYTGQAGEYIRNIKNATDGDQESGAYTGIENTIRTHR